MNWVRLKVIGPAAEINELGEVRQKLSIIGGREVRNHIRKPSISPDGRAYIAFREGGRQVNRHVHMLVAESFLPNREQCTGVRWRDGNTLNNRADNLEWTNERTARGLCDGSKLTSRQVQAIRLRLSVMSRTGESQRTIAKAYGVHHSMISRIKSGNRWGRA